MLQESVKQIASERNPFGNRRVVMTGFFKVLKSNLLTVLEKPISLLLIVSASFDVNSFLLDGETLEEKDLPS